MAAEMPRHTRTHSLMQTEAYELASTQRKKIESLFGEVKHILALTRLRLRGLTGARDEFLTGSFLIAAGLGLALARRT